MKHQGGNAGTLVVGAWGMADPAVKKRLQIKIAGISERIASKQLPDLGHRLDKCVSRQRVQ